MSRWFASILASLSLAGFAAAQDNPIAELQVKPVDTAYKNAWNKPYVIKSAEEAVKYFETEARDVIAKKVDFKKQIVLVFAWQGSGGDKLEYKILESFPEQIPFTLKPGLTRDLRQHSRVFVVRSNVRWSVPGAKGDKAKDEKQTIRPVPFKATDPTVAFKIGSQSKLTAMTDADAAEKLVGAASAKGLVSEIDFAKEQLVLVSWTTSGPPDGKLMHEVAKDGGITFYVQGPAGVKARGQRARIGADFFAVPKEAKVTFDSKER